MEKLSEDDKIKFEEAKKTKLPEFVKLIKAELEKKDVKVGEKDLEDSLINAYEEMSKEERFRVIVVEW